MRKIIATSLILGILLGALPAVAEPTEPPKERHQETISVGDNRFLIFVGAPGESQDGYTVDLIKTENGVPHFDTLFIEDYDIDTRNVSISEGVAFQAISYHYDKATNMLDYTTIAPDIHVRYQYKYKFSGDRFLLQEVILQEDLPCPEQPCTPAKPEVIFTVADDAKTH